MTERLLKILCLHGYRQTGDTFKERTGAFRKILKKRVEFVFMTAPLIVPPMDESSDNGGNGWWFSRSDDYFKAQDDSDCVKGYEESLAAIEDMFLKHGPFDGIMGFSQGAAMLALVCGLQQQGKLSYSFKFAIMVSSFRSHSLPHQDVYIQKILLPTLHVYGETDQVIEKSMSVELLKYFIDPSVIEHPGGHFIPATTTQKGSYLNFIEQMKQICLSS